MAKYFGIALVMFAVASTAVAATTYTNEATFLANILPGYYLEDFTGWTYGWPLDGSQTDYDFGPVNGWSWHAYATQGLWSNVSALSTNNMADPLVITFPGNPNPVTAVGGIVASTDIYGNIIQQVVTATLNDGTQISTTGIGFAGFTSAVPIVSLTLDGIDSPSYNWPQLDHFYVGAIIPEPASFGLFGLGVLALLRRR